MQEENLKTQKRVGNKWNKLFEVEKGLGEQMRIGLSLAHPDMIGL